MSMALEHQAFAEFDNSHPLDLIPILHLQSHRLLYHPGRPR